MEYTKGDWEVEQVGDCSLIMVDDKTCVARTYLTYYPKESEQANANLIAAAPDMYEALTWARVEIYTRMKEVGDEEINPILQSIELALAKARGE